MDDDKEIRKAMTGMGFSGDQLMETIVDNYETDDLHRLLETLGLILDASEMIKVDKETVKVFMLRGIFEVAQRKGKKLNDLRAEAEAELP